MGIAVSCFTGDNPDHRFFYAAAFAVLGASILSFSKQIAGILQVFSFLVIPALIGRLYTRNPLQILLKGWGIGFVVCVVGVTLSYRLDVHTAPLIVASLSLSFFVLLGLKARRSEVQSEKG